MFEGIIVPIHRAGWPFIAVSLLLALGLALLWPPLATVALFLAVFCTYFFRHPARVTPSRAGLVVSPADGRLSAIEEAVPPAELELGGAPLTRVSVFLSVFDVHINRAPVAGRIKAVAYHKGRFLNAANDKASDENERNAMTVVTSDGREVGFVQIAGLIARRIVCNVAAGEVLASGQVFGLIRFGSRMDVYLPQGVAPLVCVGQRMVAGETVIADLASDEAARTGHRH